MTDHRHWPTETEDSRGNTHDPDVLPTIEESRARIHHASVIARWVSFLLLLIVMTITVVMIRPILNARDASQAAEENAVAVRRNNAVGACRASISNSIVQPKVDAEFAAVVDLVNLNTQIDLATRNGNPVIVATLNREFADAETRLAAARTGLSDARDVYQRQIRQSGADPAAFVAMCKRKGLLDKAS